MKRWRTRARAKGSKSFLLDEAAVVPGNAAGQADASPPVSEMAAIFVLYRTCVCARFIFQWRSVSWNPTRKVQWSLICSTFNIGLHEWIGENTFLGLHCTFQSRCSPEANEMASAIAVDHLCELDALPYLSGMHPGFSSRTQCRPYHFCCLNCPPPCVVKCSFALRETSTHSLPCIFCHCRVSSWMWMECRWSSCCEALVSLDRIWTFSYLLHVVKYTSSYVICGLDSFVRRSLSAIRVAVVALVVTGLVDTCGVCRTGGPREGTCHPSHHFIWRSQVPSRDLPVRHCLECQLNLSIREQPQQNISRWEPGRLGNIQQPWSVV